MCAEAERKSKDTYITEEEFFRTPLCSWYWREPVSTMRTSPSAKSGNECPDGSDCGAMSAIDGVWYSQCRFGEVDVAVLVRSDVRLWKEVSEQMEGEVGLAWNSLGSSVA